MASTSVKPNLSLRLLIDNEKNRVVLAEFGRDFLEQLFSLVFLPLGSIVRLLEKHLNPQFSIVGCFHNLYKSVSDMDLDYFESDACKDLLLYPRSLSFIEGPRKNLKLNIDDTEATKLFLCPNFITSDQCSKVYSYLSTRRCGRCGSLMTQEIEVEKEQANEVSHSSRVSYIITHDLKFSVNSSGLILSVLSDLGYDGFGNLQEMLIDVGFQEVVTLLGCLFTSEAPLTDTFLKKDCPTMKHKVLSPLALESTGARDSDKLLTLKVYINKTDNVILYAECSEDFVDFLFTFLAHPLSFAWDRSIDNENKGCVGNVHSSMKDLLFEHPEDMICKFMLPYYYNIRSQLLDVVIEVEEVPEYEVLVNSMNLKCSKRSKKIKKNQLSVGERILKLKPVMASADMGFLKGETKFIVSDDLVVTPAKLCSTVSMLRKLKTRISDIEEHVISIGKSEAISILRASLITTSALNNGLSNFLSKLKPTKAASSASKIKTENTL